MGDADEVHPRAEAYVRASDVYMDSVRFFLCVAREKKLTRKPRVYRAKFYEDERK